MLAVTRQVTRSSPIALAGFLLLLSTVTGAACADDDGDSSLSPRQQEQERLPRSTYAPVVNVYSPSMGAVSYGSWLEGRGGVGSSVVILVREPSARYGALHLQIACLQDEINIFLFGLPDAASPDQVEVVLAFDLGSPQTQFWQGAGVLGLELTGDPADELYAVLRHVQRLSVTVPEVGVGPTEFPVAQLFDTPIQGNLDYCGDYHPSEWRLHEPKYVPLVGVSGKAGEHLTYEASERDFGGRSVLSTVVQVAPMRASDAVSNVRLTLSCRVSGNIEVQLEGLPRREQTSQFVAVTMTMDEGEPTTDVWWIETSADSVVADTESYGLLSGVLLAETMTLSIPDLDIEYAEFDLRGLFHTPLQGNLDHCGRYDES